MHKKYFIHAFLFVGLFYPGATYGVGLAVGVFGGYAVPTGDMAAEEGFGLRESSQISGKVLFNVNNRYSLEIGTGYHFGYPPTTKSYSWVEDTKAVTVTGGANFKVNLWKVAFYGSGGAGYYFIDTRVVSTVEEDGLGGWAYPVEVSINGAGIYCGGGVAYDLGKFSFNLAPRFNYIFNEGTYDGEMVDGPVGYRGRSIPVFKRWNDSYFELTAGVVYTLF